MQSHSHQSRVFLNIISIFLCFSAIQCETFPENYSHPSLDFTLIASQRRFARQRCLQQYPHADALGFSDTADTHCFLQCLLLKMGLMDLRTRGLDASKFLDIWDDIEEASEEKCMFRFALDEPLSGKCSDCYRKLMEFRAHCFALFEHTFAVGSTLGAKEVFFISNYTRKDMDYTISQAWSKWSFPDLYQMKATKIVNKACEPSFASD